MDQIVSKYGPKSAKEISEGDQTMKRTLFLAAFPLAACSQSPVAFSDTIDLTFDFGFFQDTAAGLHTPYVQGTDFILTVRHRSDHDMTGWEVRSSDPALFDLSCFYDDENRVFDCDAVTLREGFAEVIVLDDRGEEVGQIEIESALPDRVELLPHGPLIIDQPALIDDAFLVLETGTSTWLARYYLGDRRLHGNGTLSVEGSDAFSAWTEDSFLFEDRDWLQGIANTQGEHPVSLMVDGVYINDVVFTAVGAEEIDRVELHGMDEATASPEDTLVVLAQAYSATDTAIYGVAFDWQLDGSEEWGEGDLYRYTYSPESEHSVSASVDGLGAEVTIHGDGFVDSTNNIGCSSLSGASPGLLGGLLGLLGLARRRQYPGPANR